ncbi:hypothetical protein BEWA_051330 [Theileria equi strain WA]|uniref:Uncharacterized protein n=1 Tax=Theileria equi strain WA TaxID=1537102 RepID=L1LCL3_THEEQ|nr:hypothetical protein BEWA_051330 [Theileria equi strain WA]EKX73081.1 hypothetical protein BEWA_051330 [Theileria equi strain WA]|eukprot:XP_004832533.1 hypothetical protein BEWA_051330 [Theileria equi strain WA]
MISEERSPLGSLLSRGNLQRKSSHLNKTIGDDNVGMQTAASEISTSRAETIKGVTNPTLISTSDVADNRSTLSLVEGQCLPESNQKIFSKWVRACDYTESKQGNILPLKKQQKHDDSGRIRPKPIVKQTGITYRASFQTDDKEFNNDILGTRRLYYNLADVRLALTLDELQCGPEFNRKNLLYKQVATCKTTQIIRGINKPSERQGGNKIMALIVIVEERAPEEKLEDIFGRFAGILTKRINSNGQEIKVRSKYSRKILFIKACSDYSPNLRKIRRSQEG